MDNSEDGVRSEIELAENVRRACVEAALEGYERAAISGLCHEGAWEAAISAIRMVDLVALLGRGEMDSQPLLRKEGGHERAGQAACDALERSLDAALADTFPASDPIALTLQRSKRDR